MLVSGESGGWNQRGGHNGQYGVQRAVTTAVLLHLYGGRTPHHTIMTPAAPGRAREPSTGGRRKPSGNFLEGFLGTVAYFPIKASHTISIKKDSAK